MTHDDAMLTSETKPADGQKIRFVFRLPMQGDKTFVGTYREGRGVFSDSGTKLIRWPSRHERPNRVVGWEPVETNA